MSTTILAFRNDKWLTIPADQLQPGDLFNHEGTLLEVEEAPYAKGSSMHIPASLHESGPIQLDLSGGVLARVMDMVGSSLAVFEDGTAILTELDWNPGFTYSPRLPKPELEAFCTQHFDRYSAFYEANRDRIDSGENVAMEPWW